MDLQAAVNLHMSGRLRGALEVPDAWSGPATEMTDRAGRPLGLGSAVLLKGSEHTGRVGEVVGCGGRRGIEVVVHGSRPAFLAVPSALLELVDVVLLDPIIPGPQGRYRRQAV